MSSVCILDPAESRSPALSLSMSTASSTQKLSFGCAGLLVAPAVRLSSVSSPESLVVLVVIRRYVGACGLP